MSENVENNTVEEQVVNKPDEVLGDGGIKALQAEREARKQAVKEKADLEKQIAEANKRLEAFEDAQRTEEERRANELEKAREVAKAAEERAAQAERKALLATIATEEGIPASHIHRIVGSTEEELRSDAKALAESLNIGGGRKPAPVPNLTNDQSRSLKVSKGELFENAWRGAFG